MGKLSEKERLKKVERLEQVRKEITDAKKDLDEGLKATPMSEQENPDFKKGKAEQEDKLAALQKEEGTLIADTFVSDKAETPSPPPAPVEIEVDEEATAEAENESETFKVSEEPGPDEPEPLEGEPKSKKKGGKKASQHPAEPADMFK